MESLSHRTLGDIAKVRAALSFEPHIRPDLTKADLSTVIRVMFCLMWNRVDQAAAIFRYLENHGCGFDRATIDFVLGAFEGEDPEWHLWTRHNLGDYEPLIEAMPIGDFRNTPLNR